jgi:hypothetical protein
MPRDRALFIAMLPWRQVEPDRVVREMEAAVVDDPAMLESPVMFLLVDVLGTQGNEARLREMFAALERARGVDDANVQLRKAFWFSVFEKYDAAAEALKRVEPVPEEATFGGMGSGIVMYQALPAALRVYRATGRTAQADELARHYLAKWRATRNEDPEAVHWYRTDLAALAASEGHRDEAVELLREEMRSSDLSGFFRPTLPWFRSLEGHPGFDKLIRERAERVERIRAEMLAIEKANTNNTTATP